VISTYSDGFKQRMVQRMTGANAISAMALSREVGVSQSSLSKWLREASRVPTMKNDAAEQNGRQRRPKDWSAEEKMTALMTVAAMPDAELGEFLRKSGLHEAQIKEWRSTILAALSGTQKSADRKKTSADAKRINELEKDIRRKDRALAEVTALLTLKKKLNALWGGEDDDTAPRNET
jgi:transposase